MRRDEDNLVLAHSTDSVDAINATFYGRFQFPWPPLTFSKPTQPDLEAVMLNQSLGSWNRSIVPTEPKIWVAGCGTNQAIFTALRFPKATILGTDLSAPSLETASQNARTLGISNLELKEESINHASYAEEFDYIICTGVIHHNADPAEPLQNLTRALKKGGVLELMVYNRYHRIITTAFQKAIRMFGDGPANGDFERELMITKKILAGTRFRNLFATLLETYKGSKEAELADALLQPVEYSFTVDSFQELVDRCGLELLLPCINQYDKASGSFNWNMEFSDPGLQEDYDSFPDLKRWQISNHLMLERSPMLWFYVGRKDSGRPRKPEVQVCQEFLDLGFEKSDTQKIVYKKTVRGDYLEGKQPLPYPGLHEDALCRQVIASVEAQPAKTMREIFHHLEIDTALSQANRVRLCLTTNAFPYLKARTA